MTEKKPPKKAAPAPEKPAAPDAPQVIGPGVVKRPKRDPAAAADAGEPVPYTPSEQVFRRRG